MDAATPVRPTGPLLFLIADPADAPAADQLAQALDDRGFRAWSAPLADPATGLLDPRSMAALEAADRALVLVSATAGGSDRIDKSLIVARQIGKPVIAFRMADAPSSPPASLAGATWLGPADTPAAAAAQVAALLQPPIPAAVAPPPVAAVPPRRRSRAGLAAGLGIAVLLAAAGGAALVLTTPGLGPTHPGPEMPTRNVTGLPVNGTTAVPVIETPPSAPVPAPSYEEAAPFDTTPAPGEDELPVRPGPTGEAPAADSARDGRRIPSAPERPAARPAAPSRPEERAYSPRRDGAVPPVSAAPRTAAKPPPAAPRDTRGDSSLPPGFGPAPRERRRSE